MDYFSFYKSIPLSCPVRHGDIMPTIPALGRLRQDDKSPVIRTSISKLSLKKLNNKTKYSLSSN